MYGIFRTDKGYKEDNWYCGTRGVSWGKKSSALLYKTAGDAVRVIDQIAKDDEELTVVKITGRS